MMKFHVDHSNSFVFNRSAIHKFYDKFDFVLRKFAKNEKSLNDDDLNFWKFDKNYDLMKISSFRLRSRRNARKFKKKNLSRFV